jgi:hypothetical protein
MGNGHLAPLPKLVKRLSERGFCSTEGEPTPKSGWAFLDAEQIVSLYSESSGIQNYSRFADNWGQLNRILRAMNRKQIPVCATCHARIHRGEYDGIKLSDLAYIPR